jgi:hypothetical protein
VLRDVGVLRTMDPQAGALYDYLRSVDVAFSTTLAEEPEFGVRWIDFKQNRTVERGEDRKPPGPPSQAATGTSYFTVYQPGVSTSVPGASGIDAAIPKVHRDLF